MLISQASAAHFMPPSESAGGGIALAIILGGLIALYLVYRGRKKWRANKAQRESSED